MLSAIGIYVWLTAKGVFGLAASAVEVVNVAIEAAPNPSLSAFRRLEGLISFFVVIFSFQGIHSQNIRPTASDWFFYFCMISLTLICSPDPSI